MENNMKYLRRLLNECVMVEDLGVYQFETDLRFIQDELDVISGVLDGL